MHAAILVVEIVMKANDNIVTVQICGFVSDLCLWLVLCELPVLLQTSTKHSLLAWCSQLTVDIDEESVAVAVDGILVTKM